MSLRMFKLSPDGASALISAVAAQVGMPTNPTVDGMVKQIIGTIYGAGGFMACYDGTPVIRALQQMSPVHPPVQHTAPAPVQPVYAAPPVQARASGMTTQPQVSVPVNPDNPPSMTTIAQPAVPAAGEMQ
jgi:hypothetical protein